MSNLAISELTRRVRKLSREKLLELPPEELAQLEQVLTKAKYDQIDALCRQEVASFEAGPLLWLTRYTKTENPQYEEQGLPFLAGFPRKSYFVPLFGAFLARH